MSLIMNGAAHGGGGGRSRGFTLTELLVVAGILVVLLSAATVGGRSILLRAYSARTVADLRNLGQYVALRVGEHEGCMPRSRHSGANFAYPERIKEIWGYEYFAFVGARGSYLDAADRTAFVNAWLRSPLDDRTDAQEGYGFNVYFELRGAADPDGPAETADGASWRKSSTAPAPASTVLFAETGVPPAAPGVTPQPRDHFMAHFWSQFSSDTSHEVRNEPASVLPVFCFLDGHTEAVSFDSTFRLEPGASSPLVDRWNPAAACSSR